MARLNTFRGMFTLKKSREIGRLNEKIVKLNEEISRLSKDKEILKAGLSEMTKLVDMDKVQKK